MNTATATAKTPERNITPCELLEVVEAFGISLYPPRRGGGGGWMSGWKGEAGYVWGFGDSPTTAVEDLLRRITDG